MNAKAETQSISIAYDLPHPPAKVGRALSPSCSRRDSWPMTFTSASACVRDSALGSDGRGGSGARRVAYWGV